jgi:hypothetical protein
VQERTGNEFNLKGSRVDLLTYPRGQSCGLVGQVVTSYLSKLRQARQKVNGMHCAWGATQSDALKPERAQQYLPSLRSLHFSTLTLSLAIPLTSLCSLSLFSSDSPTPILSFPSSLPGRRSLATTPHQCA